MAARSVVIFIAVWSIVSKFVPMELTFLISTITITKIPKKEKKIHISQIFNQRHDVDDDFTAIKIFQNMDKCNILPKKWCDYELKVHTMTSSS